MNISRYVYVRSTSPMVISAATSIDATCCKKVQQCRDAYAWTNKCPQNFWRSKFYSLVYPDSACDEFHAYTTQHGTHVKFTTTKKGRGRGGILFPVLHTSRDSLLVERLTRDRKVASSNPGRSGGILSQSWLCVLTLIRCPFHPQVTVVTCKRPKSYCHRCR